MFHNMGYSKDVSVSERKKRKKNQGGRSVDRFPFFPLSDESLLLFIVILSSAFISFVESIFVSVSLLIPYRREEKKYVRVFGRLVLGGVFPRCRIRSEALTWR